MTKIAIALALALTACASDPDYYDPNGHWTMTLTWGSGDCGLTGASSETLIVTQTDDSHISVFDQSDPPAVASGSVKLTEETAELKATSYDADIFRDGGSTQGTLSVHVTADSNMAIVGTGDIQVSGAFTCSQVCTVAGALL